MKFKKLFSVICSFSMMISSIFCCKADPVYQRVVFLGAERVGKTQIVNQWVNDNFSECYVPTMSAEFFSKLIDADLHAHLLDTTGAEKRRCLLNIYCYKASIAVIVADLTNDESINGVSDFINLVKDKSSGAKILLVGNKADLITSEGELNQQLNKLRNKAIEHCLNIDDKDIIAVSARTKYGIDLLENRISEILQSLPPQNNSLTESTGDTSNIGTSSNKYSKYLTGAGLVALIAGTGLLIKKHFTSNDTQKNESL